MKAPESVAFFSVLFACRHAQKRGHITEEQAEQLLMSTPGNRIPIEALLPLVENAGAAQPDEVVNLIVIAETEGRITL